MNHNGPAATRLTMTSQHGSEALGLGYCHIMTIRSDESSMVALLWVGPVMPLKGSTPQTRRRGGDASVIFSWETSGGPRGGQTTGRTQN